MNDDKWDFNLLEKLIALVLRSPKSKLQSILIVGEAQRMILTFGIKLLELCFFTLFVFPTKTGGKKVNSGIIRAPNRETKGIKGDCKSALQTLRISRQRGR